MKSFKEHLKESEPVDALDFLLGLADGRHKIDHETDIKKTQKPVLDAIAKIENHIKDIVSKYQTLKNKEYKDNKSVVKVGDHGGFNDNPKSLTISQINQKKKQNTLKSYKDEFTFCHKIVLALQTDIKYHEVDYKPVVDFDKNGFIKMSGLPKRVADHIDRGEFRKVPTMPG